MSELGVEMPKHSTRVTWLLAAMVLTGQAALAQGEAYTGMAAVAGGAADKSSVTLTVVVRRYASSAEREALIAAVKKGGAGSAHTLLAKRDTIGTVDVGGRKTPLKYAYAFDMNGRRQITLVTADPVAMPNVKHEPGYDVGFILLDVDASGSGVGEFVPAAKAHVDEQNAIVTENSSVGMLRLTGITRK
jgi:hypothetical protein